MRPLITADPMLRTPRPEMTPESTAGVAAFPGARAGALPAVAAEMALGPAMIARTIDALFAGNLKMASFTSTLASAVSMVKRMPLGPPLRPDSIEKGIQ